MERVTESDKVNMLTCLIQQREHVVHPITSRHRVLRSPRRVDVRLRVLLGIGGGNYVGLCRRESARDRAQSGHRSMSGGVPESERVGEGCRAVSDVSIVVRVTAPKPDGILTDEPMPRGMVVSRPIVFQACRVAFAAREVVR